MKIVLISASTVPSTAANSIEVMKVANALTSLSHQVILIVPGEKSIGWSDLAAWYGLSTEFEMIWMKENQAWRRYDFSLKAVSCAHKLNPDLVYTWPLQAAVFALWHRIPVILELHDRISGRFAPFLFKTILHSRTPKRLIFNTHALRNLYQQKYRSLLKEEITQVGPNGIELERYISLPDPATARKTLSLKAGISVGYTGHFYSGRGIEILLQLAESFPGINFLWVGGTSEAVEEWRSVLATKHITNVTLTGFIPNQQLALYQAACEILLMPYGRVIAGSSGGNSVDVCSPMKMFEYLAAGRAIISSDLPVLHEVLNNQNALFCPADEPQAWRDALAALINDPARIQALALQAKLDSQQYSWKQRAERSIAGFLN